jgi:hypothetical protein
VWRAVSRWLQSVVKVGAALGTRPTAGGTDPGRGRTRDRPAETHLPCIRAKRTKGDEPSRRPIDGALLPSSAMPMAQFGAQRVALGALLRREAITGRHLFRVSVIDDLRTAACTFAAAAGCVVQYRWARWFAREGCEGVLTTQLHAQVVVRAIPAVSGCVTTPECEMR